MVDIRGIKKDRKKQQGKNIMSASATQGGHKNTLPKYNSLPLSLEQYAGDYITQPFCGPFSGINQVSRCQKRTSGLYGARED